ncbi:MAG: endopeptidase La, partial [Deltaproteobacteria bacterium]|nr:endopeptidase La [Deltaproteobacteria bacterium]
MSGDGIIGLVASKDGDIEEPKPGQTYEVGTLAKIERVVRESGDTLQIVVSGLERFRIDHWVTFTPFLRANAVPAPESLKRDVELDALERSLREITREIIGLSPNLPKEMGEFLSHIKDPAHLLYTVAATVGPDVKKGQALLELDDMKPKLRMLVAHLSREKEVLTLNRKIRSEAHEEMDKAQRDYYLRQQLKAIQKELGESTEETSVSDEYSEKLKQAGLPEEAMKEAERELGRLSNMSPQSPEYSLIKTYLDWLAELPWTKASEDHMDIPYARQVLDKDHYDLDGVKERIIEYLAVRKLLKERLDQTAETKEPEEHMEGMGVILCFAGPPGVGKTSLGQSIARALGRRFTRMSLGGMRDEAEIRGHRRTYVGAMPGRIIQAVKRAGTRNPVFMLDEVDKVGSDWRGDPSSALLEVLDPAQNHAFRDYYLDVDFDLSDVMFITTANQLETIPSPLRDRMEIIQLEGYTEYEKQHIAQQYLVPRQLKINGLRKDEIDFEDDAVRKIIQDYTREAGVRNLERNIGSVCRKAAVGIAEGEAEHVHVTPDVVRSYLKKERFESEVSEAIEIPGIATGLAVTPVGGDILFIEATMMNGNGRLTLTGQLGDVMRESAQIAHSYVRSKIAALRLDVSLFKDADIHVHVPAGAIPKDGPSAGLPMVTAVISLCTGRPVHSEVGLTGEVTLRGRVLSVGGIKMKLLAAHRAGLKTVILPKRNEKDLEELPREVQEDLNIVFVETIDEVLEKALCSEKMEVNLPLAAND